jgi:hypothetical protein
MCYTNSIQGLFEIQQSKKISLYELTNQIKTILLISSTLIYFNLFFSITLTKTILWIFYGKKLKTKNFFFLQQFSYQFEILFRFKTKYYIFYFISFPIDNYNNKCTTRRMFNLF